MLTEFREYLMRGNVVDLAVAVIIGAAFGAIVASMVNDVIMPPIGVLSGGLDFKDHRAQPGKSSAMYAFERTSAGLAGRGAR